MAELHEDAGGGLPGRRREEGLAETAEDHRDVYLTKGLETYHWAEETHRQADDTWQRVRVWVYDPLGKVWLAFRDRDFEDESRRMAGRTNYFGTTLENMVDYLSNWGGYDKSVSVFTPIKAASVADVIAKVWPGAMAVSGTSDEQAATEKDPIGIGRGGKPRRAWGQK